MARARRPPNAASGNGADDWARAWYLLPVDQRPWLNEQRIAVGLPPFTSDPMPPVQVDESVMVWVTK